MDRWWRRARGVEEVPAEESTDYPGGRVSTKHPLDAEQAAAIVAHVDRRARDVLALLEGAGLVAGRGYEGWVPDGVVSEGRDQFHDLPWNGRQLRLNLPMTRSDESESSPRTAQRFAAMPAEAVESVRHVDPHESVRFPRIDNVWAYLELRGTSRTAELRVGSEPYFFAWSNELFSEATERSRLGFRSRVWEAHTPLPGGLSEQEAVTRVRLYLIGRGVPVAGSGFEARRTDDRWAVTSSAGTLVIGDDGRITT